MTEKVHFRPFACAIQALILPKENYDSTLNVILRDALEFFANATFANEADDDAMEEDFEEGGKCNDFKIGT